MVSWGDVLAVCFNAMLSIGVVVQRSCFASNRKGVEMLSWAGAMLNWILYGSGVVSLCNDCNASVLSGVVKVKQGYVL